MTQVEVQQKRYWHLRRLLTMHWLLDSAKMLYNASFLPATVAGATPRAPLSGARQRGDVIDLSCCNTV